ncbi:hypothetical protein C8R45DRAFT_1004153 [Mycena sanguinolenta]|nr:hypothetical protein C8R45DRAFT_1004153 [Mycena sanguinolenta]
MIPVHDARAQVPPRHAAALPSPWSAPSRVASTWRCPHRRARNRRGVDDSTRAYPSLCSRFASRLTNEYRIHIISPPGSNAFSPVRVASPPRHRRTGAARFVALLDAFNGARCRAVQAVTAYHTQDVNATAMGRTWRRRRCCIRRSPLVVLFVYGTAPLVLWALFNLQALPVLADVSTFVLVAK